MKAIGCTILSFGLILGLQRSTAQEQTQLPATLPPVQAIASMDDEGRILIRIKVHDYRLVNGNFVITARDDQCRFETTQLDVFNSSGKEIDRKKLPGLLKKETPALFTGIIDKFDPLHLRLVKEGTLLFVARPPVLRVDKTYVQTIQFIPIGVSIPVEKPNYYLSSRGHVDDVEADQRQVFRSLGIMTQQMLYTGHSQNGVSIPIRFGDDSLCVFIWAKKDAHNVISVARLEHEKYHALVRLNSKGAKLLSAAIKEKGFDVNLESLDEELAASVVEVLSIHLQGIALEQLSGSTNVVLSRDILLKARKTKEKEEKKKD